MIDAHHHVWDLSVREQPWMVGDALAPLRRDFLIGAYEQLAHAAGIVRSVVVQTVSKAAETPELLATAAASSVAAGVVGWVDLTRPDVADRLAELQEGPTGHLLVGIRHQVQDEPDPQWLGRRDVRHGLAAVGAAGLVFDLLVTPAQLPAATAAVRSQPDMTFVLDHAGKPPVASGALEPWAAGLTTLSAAGTVYCKLSGLVTEAEWGRWTAADLRPYAQTVLATFGAARVMLGSDWPVCTLAGSYPDVVGAYRSLLDGASAAEVDEVTRAAAVRAYRLAPSAGPALR